MELQVDGANISSGTASPTGQAGDVVINVNTLKVTGGGFIDSGTLASPSGRAGSVTINAANSVSVSGKDNTNFPSVISSATLSGQAGQITIITPTLLLDGGGTAFGTTHCCFIASTQGGGAAGTIVLNVGSVTLTGGAQITTKTTGSGPGGTVTVSADTISISGTNSGLFSNSTSNGAGGNIFVQGRQVQLSDGAIISAQSSGTGNAGNITITAPDTLQLTNGSITTEAIKGDGGNITIHTGSLIRADNSDITATVKSGVGNGGNITIDPDAFILNHSRVIAQAFGGNGGNINITAGVFLFDPSSVLSASSALGVNGTIQIQSPVQNLSGTLSPLPSTLLKIPPLTAQCAARAQGGTFSSFTVAGRDGVPAEPGGLLPSPLQEAVTSSPYVSSDDLPISILIALNLEGRCGQ